MGLILRLVYSRVLLDLERRKQFHENIVVKMFLWVVIASSSSMLTVQSTISLQLHWFRPTARITNDSNPPSTVLSLLQCNVIAVCCKPRMCQGLLRSVSVLNVVGKERRDKCHGFIRDVSEQLVRKCVFALHDRRLDRLVVLSIEWWCSAQKHVNNHTQTPQVASLRVRLLQYFWSDVVRRSYHSA